MHERKNNMVRTHHSQPAKAFTLIELLVVIAIIALLVSIVVPSFGRFKDMAKATVAKSRVAALNGACELYYGTYHMYPGQDTDSIARLKSTGNDRLTGTQVLVRAIFDFNVDPADSTKWDRTNRQNPRLLTELNPDDLDVNGTIFNPPPAPAGPRYSVMDHFTKQMPFLYYPARLGVTGVTSIYIEDDNRLYYKDNGAVGTYGEKDDNVACEPGAPTKTGFAKFIENPTTALGGATPGPYREDTYLIIGAGIDRKYFNDDDTANFNFGR